MLTSLVQTLPGAAGLFVSYRLCFVGRAALLAQLTRIHGNIRNTEKHFLFSSCGLLRLALVVHLNKVEKGIRLKRNAFLDVRSGFKSKMLSWENGNVNFKRKFTKIPLPLPFSSGSLCRSIRSSCRSRLGLRPYCRDVGSGEHRTRVGWRLGEPSSKQSVVSTLGGHRGRGL